jgi:hypothetical protein
MSPVQTLITEAAQQALANYLLIPPRMTPTPKMTNSKTTKMTKAMKLQLMLCQISKAAHRDLLHPSHMFQCGVQPRASSLHPLEGLPGLVSCCAQSAVIWGLFLADLKH